MKKLLNLTALTILSSGFTASNLTLQITNISKINNNLQDNQSPFINEVKMFNNKDVKKFYVDSKNILWICTETGLYKSSDGMNFEIIKLDNNFLNIIDIMLDSLGNYYVSADNMSIKHTNPEITVYKSSDGNKFNRVFTTAQKAYNGVLSSTNQGVFLATYTKIFASSNEKNDWYDFYDFSSDNWNIKDVLMEDSLVTTEKGIYYSDTNFSFNNATLILQNNVHDLFKHSNKIYALDQDYGYYVSTNSIGKKPNFTKISITGIDSSLTNMIIDAENNMWILSNEQLFKSTDGINFSSASNWTSGMMMNKLIMFNNTIFLGGAHGMFKSNNCSGLFLDMATPDYQGNQYNGWVFKKDQEINVKGDYIKSAVFDGSSLTIPSNKISVDQSKNGKHTLVLTLKDEIKSYALLFKNGNSQGEITCNFLIKPKITPETEINYKTNIGDTDLLVGLTSDGGNTNGKPIINTRSKSGSSHSATLDINIDSDLIDLNNSYYIIGNVDINTNDFIENGSKVDITRALTIKKDGIYHLHLIDLIGNVYDSYLELGEDNWKLKGTFDDEELKQLSAKLNVTTNLTDPTEKQEALNWLHKYETDVLTTIKNSIKLNGKGFTIDENSFQDSYKEFLGIVTYINFNTQEDIKTDIINQKINDIADSMLKNGLKNLPDLNVKTTNVVDKNTLDSYTIWISGYQKYINENKNQWFNKIINNVSRGFASQDEIAKITNYLNKIPLINYLKDITWIPEKKSLGTSNDYSKFVQLNKLQNDINNFVNDTYPNIIKKFEEAINNAEKSVNMWGYSLDQLLNGRQLPQTKTEIENYDNGKSFSQWLQDEANSKYSTWQIKMGMSIGIPLAVLLVIIGTASYWRYSKKYRPFETRTIIKRALKEVKENE